MRHGVAAIGLLSWDRFVLTDHYPGPGEYAIVRNRSEQAGGTTGNLCAALGRIGIDTMLVSRVGDDEEGTSLIASLADDGVDVTHIRRIAEVPSDSGIIIVSGSGAERDRTIYWIQGAKPTLGMQFPVDTMLDYEWIVLDIDDASLRHFFLDLPAHRSPRTRLFGTMTYLVEMDPAQAWQQALRHDVVVGNVRELRTITAAANVEDAINIAQRDMRASACRVMYISRGPAGGVAIRPNSVTDSPAFEVEVADTTGAGDAFAAGCLWGLLDHVDDASLLRRANAMGAMACQALGSRTALPTRCAIERFLETGRPQT